MKWTPTSIKEILQANLEKQGSSLEALEAELALHEKQASFKDAVGGSTALGEAAAKGMGLAGGITLGLGALGGTGAYIGHRLSQDSDDKIKKKRLERRQYEDALNSLRAAAKHSKSEG